MKGAAANEKQFVDRLTIVGLGLAMLPLMTMWHELAGHAATCAVLGGKLAAIGAFYVDCRGLARLPQTVVACAGVSVNALLFLCAFAAWRRAQSDLARLILWLLFVSQGFVAAGYFAFSGIVGVGDLAPTLRGGLGPMRYGTIVRIAETVIGIAAYRQLIMFGIDTLGDMLGGSPETSPSRRRIAHVFYATCGAAAVAVGLFNPLGLFILIASAAASSFGGLAGFISIGFATRQGDDLRPFLITRNWFVLVFGAVVLIAFALVLGPTIHPST
jgi:hypothetical protein